MHARARDCCAQAKSSCCTSSNNSLKPYRIASPVFNAPSGVFGCSSFSLFNLQNVFLSYQVWINNGKLSNKIRMRSKDQLPVETIHCIHTPIFKSSFSLSLDKTSTFSRQGMYGRFPYTMFVSEHRETQSRVGQNDLHSQVFVKSGQHGIDLGCDELPVSNPILLSRKTLIPREDLMECG